MNNRQWAVLYCQTQGFCHVEPLSLTVEHNRTALAEGKEPHYHLIGLAGDHMEADRMVQDWKRSGNAYNLHSLNYGGLEL